MAESLHCFHLQYTRLQEVKKHTLSEFVVYQFQVALYLEFKSLLHIAAI